MHDMEREILTCDDHNQWSPNKLSASQIAMANANRVSNQERYASISMWVLVLFTTIMVCAFCAKSGKHFTHPESKCYSKQRGQDRLNNK